MTSPAGPREPHKTRWRWVALGAAIALAGLAAVLLSGSGLLPGSGLLSGSGFLSGNDSRSGNSTARLAASSGRPAVTTVTSPPVTSRTEAPGGPAAIAAAAAAAPPHLSPRLASALTQWNSSRAGTAMAALSGEVGAVTQDAGLQFYSPMRLACVQVAATVTDARADSPIPDAAFQRQYAAALSAFAKAAADCQSGISAHPYGDEDIETRQNQRILHRSGAEFAGGNQDLYRATAEIRQLILSHHP
jgi:hypothetical protein